MKADRPLGFRPLLEVYLKITRDASDLALCATVTTANIFPELAAAARQRRQTVAFRAWTLLRACDPDGSSSVRQADAIILLCGHLGWGTAHASRVLRQGDGDWWRLVTARRTGDEMLRLIGVQKVALRLKTVPGRTVVMPLNRLSGHQAFAATCYAAWMALGRNNSRTISRRALGTIWSASAPTQRAWEREAGIRVRENWATLPECSPQEEALSRAYPDRDDPAVRVVTLPDGSAVVQRQIPNTYTGKMKVKGNGSRMRQVASLCRWYLITAARNKSDTGSARQARLYFSSYVYARNLKAAGRHVRKTDGGAFVFALVNDMGGVGQWMAI